IIRTESELVQALTELDGFRERVAKMSVAGGRAYNPGWNLATDLPSMLAVTTLVTKGAIERRESRGGHTRDDYPKADPELGKVNMVQRLDGRGEYTLNPEPIPVMPDELQVLFEEGK
ncbi:MAG: fumarate reductase/succinate dehydrogenase flavoprotein subunit, partial [Acidimicrobiales bacterium]|nr:fumarate reductase/succinate dehydrogenase flavoprotein subunit [Acidimicrobiales bacterium]